MRRVALVTGAGRRIGADVARHLATIGFDVLVHVRSSVEAGEKVVDEILGAGGRARLVTAELTDKAEVMRMFDGVSSDGGAVSVIVNNASHFQYDRPEAPRSGYPAKKHRRSRCGACCYLRVRHREDERCSRNDDRQYSRPESGEY